VIAVWIQGFKIHHIINDVASFNLGLSIGPAPLNFNHEQLPVSRLYLLRIEQDRIAVVDTWQHGVSFAVCNRARIWRKVFPLHAGRAEHELMSLGVLIRLYASA
jgi:hypothetical protein